MDIAPGGSFDKARALSRLFFKRLLTMLSELEEDLADAAAEPRTSKMRAVLGLIAQY